MSTTRFQSPLLNQLAERIAKLPFDPTPHPYSVLIAITNEAEPKILYSLRASDMREHAAKYHLQGADAKTQTIATKLPRYEKRMRKPVFIPVK